MAPDSGHSAERLKVAIVAPSLRYVGGPAVQADLLVRLWRHDPDVEMSFIGIDPLLPVWIAWAESIRGLRTLLREPLYFIHLWRGLKDVDIAHIFSSSYWSFLIAATPAWLVAKLLGKKALINHRSGDVRDHLQRFRSGVFVLSRADEIVVPSAYLVDVLREFRLEPLIVPNLVDLSQFRYRERSHLRPHLLCTRGFSAYYGVDVVVRAFAEVKRVYPSAQLDLVGEGPLETEIRRLVHEMKLTGVNFAGVASRQEIGDCYDRADIFINASSLDNMPVSVIEAFRAGTPVVTTAPESMPYMVEHERTGLLSAVGDDRALAANVIRLLEDAPLAARLVQNAYQESQKYTWGVVREQWLRVYRGMLDPFEVAGAPSRPFARAKPDRIHTYNSAQPSNTR
jgi:glycosyltransferase involved in cell wall biosynthesis